MTTITPGTENDENIIVEMVYDKGGRLTARRNPAGELTTYAYDDLDRRVGLANPLNHTWETTYTDLPGAGQRTTLTDPNGHDTLRTTDWLGRVRSIAYGDPATTPDVVFGYDGAGNRTRMTEYGGAGFTNPVRETQFAHDAAGRMTQVGFDADGMGGADVTVSYAYDAGGLRTAMSLSTGETLGYRYDVQGRLVGMTDFDGAETRFSYDRLGRQVATFRPNGLRTVYQYDRASRLKRLAHEHGGRALAEFRYDLDGRGNRVRATETLAHPAGGGDTLITHADPLVVYSGSWSDTGTDHTSQSGEAVLSIVFFGKDNVTLTMGEGGNHSRYDVYVDRRLWRTLDGYAPTSDTRQIHIPLDGTGPHLLEIRNRREHGKTCRENTPAYDAGIHTVRFVSLTVEGTYTHRQVDYTYDALSRLVSAVDEADSYAYTYDVAGNRLSETHNSATTDYSYNAANQLTGEGVRTYTYDDNGNLISVTDGSLATTYTWDCANRMLSDGTIHHAYDGLGNRVKTIQPYQSGTDTIQHLLDMQPGLTKVIGADTSRWVSGVSASLQDRYVHTPHGIHWQRHDVLPGPYGGGLSSSQYTLQDGLGSVRSWVSAGSTQMQMIQHYAPYGEPMTPMGAGFGFTGEQTDSNGLMYLRARYYDPSVGVFTSLDPLETPNRYAYVGGNVINRTDPTGLQGGFVDQPWDGVGGWGGLALTTFGLLFVSYWASQSPELASSIINWVFSRPELFNRGILIQPNVPDEVTIGNQPYDTYELEILRLAIEAIEGSAYAPVRAYPDELDYGTPRNPNDPGEHPSPQDAKSPNPLIDRILRFVRDRLADQVLREIKDAICSQSTPSEDANCKNGIRKTVYIPDSLLPGQIVSNGTSIYSDLATAPFHAGQPTVNKNDVECIASGMLQGIYPSYHFSFAQYNGRSRINTQQLYGYDHTQLASHWMMVDGHHRFLAWLLTGIIPQNVSPTSNFSGFPLHPPVPWDFVTWEAGS